MAFNFACGKSYRTSVPGGVGRSFCERGNPLFLLPFIVLPSSIWWQSYTFYHKQINSSAKKRYNITIFHKCKPFNLNHFVVVEEKILFSVVRKSCASRTTPYPSSHKTFKIAIIQVWFMWHFLCLLPKWIQFNT